MNMALPANPAVGFGTHVALCDAAGGIEPWKSLLLYSLVRALGPEMVAEIGVYKGSTTAWIAQGLEENGAGMLFAIDKRECPQARALIQQGGLGERVTWFDKTVSVPVPAGVPPLDLVFVDGDHSYEGCLRDIDAYWPLVKQGGLMVFDDLVPWPGCGDVHGAVRARFKPEHVIWLPTLPHPLRQIRVMMAMVQKGLPPRMVWTAEARIG